MMSSKSTNYLKREACGFCSKHILYGQPTTICNKCDLIFHGKCVKPSNLKQYRGSSYCTNCIIKYDIDTRRYNPFYNIFNDEHSDRFYDDEPTEFVESIEHISNLLKDCSRYDYKTFNELTKNFTNDEYFSTFFLNIDGNQTNFDQLVAEMSQLDHEFSVIGLAETNTDMTNKICTISQIITHQYTNRIYKVNIKVVELDFMYITNTILLNQTVCQYVTKTLKYFLLPLQI